MFNKSEIVMWSPPEYRGGNFEHRVVEAELALLGLCGITVPVHVLVIDPIRT